MLLDFLVPASPHNPKSGLTLMCCAILLFSVPTYSQETTEESRTAWVLDTSYSGYFKDSFNTLRYEIPILMRQTLIDVSVRLGMNFNEGWRYPLTVGFVDGSPPGVENALAYVELYSTNDGIRQNLKINLAAYDREKFNFEKTLAHELIHAMVNDAIGAQSAQILPIWFHEGLAVYGADQGERMVQSYVYQYTGFAESRLLNGLDGPHTGLDYAEDYLAFKYLYKEHGSNSLHNFVREVIHRKGDIPGALEYTCFETWEEFQENARKFAEEEIKKVGPARKGKYKRPY